MMQKQKRFPFFVAPAPKFLFRKLKTTDSFVVLVRVTPDITVINYVNHALYLVFFFLALFSMICVCLELVFSNMPYIIFMFLAHYGWLLLTSMYTGYVLPQRLQIDVVVFWAMVGCFSGLLWIAAQARRTLREFCALRKMHTRTEAEHKDFSLQRFLHFSLPLWLSYSVNYEPTADELLILLREREKATEQQTQDIAATLEDTEEESAQDEQPSLSMLMTLTSSLTLSIIAPGDRRVIIEFTDAVVSLVGFLATRARGVWTTKEELFRQVYDPGKESAFAMHRQRANTQVITGAQKAGFFPQKEGEDIPQPSEETQSTQKSLQREEDGDATLKNEEHQILEAETEAEIELFKNQIEGQISSWQLTSDCNIEVFPFLTDFYQKVVAAQAFPLVDAPPSLSLEQLRQGCHRVMEEYKSGFLASHMKKGYIWPWALPLYRKYQKDCLFVLAYANQREREYLNTCQTRNERAEAIEHIAQLYGWQASVAAGLEPLGDGVSSEQDMERCLMYYQKVKKKSAARATYHRYCELRSRSNFAYEPGEALKKRAEEVLYGKCPTKWTDLAPKRGTLPSILDTGINFPGQNRSSSGTLSLKSVNCVPHRIPT